MPMSFDQIEKALATHVKTSKGARERAHALADAKAQVESAIAPRPTAPIAPIGLPFVQPKR